MAKKVGINNPLFNTEPQQEAQEVEQATPQKNKTGRPRNTDIVRDNSVQAGLTEEFTRATFIMKVETLDALKDYAFTKRISIKEAITDIIDSFIEDYKADPDNEPLLPHKK